MMKKKKKSTQTVQVNCTVHVNSASVALFACTVQVNCIVHATIKFQKAARSCFAKFTCKT